MLVIGRKFYTFMRSIFELCIELGNKSILEFIPKESTYVGSILVQWYLVSPCHVVSQILISHRHTFSLDSLVTTSL
jgi:hypothetical protein